MKLPDDQKSCLEQLYVQNAIPLCQLLRAPGALDRITTSFNKMCDTKYESGVLHRYMVNRRKNRDWPRLGKRAREQHLGPIHRTGGGGADAQGRSGYRGP